MKKPTIVTALLVVCLLLSVKAVSNQKDSLLNSLPVTSAQDKRFVILHQLYEFTYRNNCYEAETYMLSALNIGIQINNHQFIVSSYKKLAELYEQQCMTSRAYIFYLEAKKIAEERDILEELPGLNYSIGIILYKLERFTESTTFLEHATCMAATQNQSSLETSAMLYMAFAAYHIGERRDALKTIRELEHIATVKGDKIFLSRFYYHLQAFYIALNKYELALKLNEQAYSLFTSTGDDYFSILCLKDRAVIYTALNNSQKAVSVYRKILGDLITIQNYTWLQPVILDSLSGFYNKKNDLTLSRYYKKRSEKLTDSLMSVAASIKHSANEQNNATEQAGTRSFSIFEAGIVVLLVLMTSLSIIINRRYKRIKKNIQVEKEEALLRARQLAEQEKQYTIEIADRLLEEKKELAIQQASEMAVQEAREIIEKAKEEARVLQAEVATTSVLLANKNDYLLQLQEKLKTTDDTDMKRLAKEIKTTLGDTDHWANYIKNFNLLHAQFLDRLTKKHPDLTTNEIKLICLAMTGLSNKEIAGIFSVEPESVKKARYRLKKKLNLKEEENLNYYLHSMQ